MGGEGVGRGRGAAAKVAPLPENTDTPRSPPAIPAARRVR
jgi:hypothetical protein